MRSAFRVGLTVCLALAATAMTGQTASATEPIEVLEEPAAAHCPALPTGCTLHTNAEMTLRTHFFGVEAQELRCRIELAGRNDEDGNGLITSVSITNGGHGESNCPTVMPPCTGSLPWTFTTEEVVVVSTVELHLDVCIDPFEFLTCEGEFDMVASEEGAIGGLESQHVNVTDNRIGTAFCEVDLSGEFEVGGAGGGDQVHIRHL